MDKKIITTNLIMEGGDDLVGTGLYISIDNIYSYFGPDQKLFDDLDMCHFLTSFFECQLKIFDIVDTSSLISDLLIGFAYYQVEALYKRFTINVDSVDTEDIYDIVRDRICCKYYDIIAKRSISNTRPFVTKGVMPNSNGSSDNNIDIVINNMKSMLHFRNSLNPFLCFGGNKKSIRSGGDKKRITEFLISETGDDRYEIKISEYQIDTFISEFFRYFSSHSREYIRIDDNRMERRI